MLDDPQNQLNKHWTFQMALTIQIESSSLKSCTYSARPDFWSSLAMKHLQTGRSKSFSMAGRPWMEQGRSGSMFFQRVQEHPKLQEKMSCKNHFHIYGKQKNKEPFKFFGLSYSYSFLIHLYLCNKMNPYQKSKTCKINFLFTPDREQRPLAPDEFCLSTLRHGEWRPTRCTSKPTVMCQLGESNLWLFCDSTIWISFGLTYPNGIAN